MFSTNAKRHLSFIMRAERAEFSTLSIVHLTLNFPAIFHLPRSFCSKLRSTGALLLRQRVEGLPVCSDCVIRNSEHAPRR